MADDIDQLADYSSGDEDEAVPSTAVATGASGKKYVSVRDFFSFARFSFFPTFIYFFSSSAFSLNFFLRFIFSPILFN